MSPIDEAEVTIEKNEYGKYIDRYSDSLTKNNIYTLTDEQMNKLFSKLRLRISLSSNCNLFCLFCSNEGSCYASRSSRPPHLDKIIKLCDILLTNTPLTQIDFSGGEPLLHPDFMREEYRLFTWTQKYPNVRFTLHTNGINLSPKIIDNIKNNFSRIGVSLHSTNFSNWNKITNPTGIYPLDIQKRKFQQVMSNLKYLSEQKIGNKIFLKSVIIRGINDSKEELKNFLELCNQFEFHPKLLQFDPQYPSQKKLQIKRRELFNKLKEIGVIFNEDTPLHNDPSTYIPGVNFKYKSGHLGLHSIFGCGDYAACRSCYSFLCMFVKFSNDGSRVYLKPCSVLDTQIDLTHAIEKNDFKQLFKLFKISREYLMTAPGLGTSSWNKEEEYDRSY